MNRIFYIIYMGMLVSFAPAAIDIYLSSMPVIQEVFKSSNSNIQLTLSLFFIGFAFSQLFWGPISDSFGRKRTAFVGVLIFIIASVLCAESSSIQELIFYRVLQSIGACSGIVIGISFIRDEFSSRSEMSKVLGYVLCAMMLTPMVAPILGGYILIYYGWKAIFYFLAVYGLILFFGLFFIKESHPRSLRTSINPKLIIQAYISHLRNKNFLLSAVGSATNFSIMFAFISISPFLYIKIYSVSENTFGYFFAFNALAAFLGGVIQSRFRIYNIINLGIITLFCGSIGIIFVSVLFDSKLIYIVLSLFVVTFGVGVLFAELDSLAMGYVKENIGTSASLLGVIKFSLAGIVSWVLCALIHPSLIGLIIAILFFSSITSLCILLLRL